MDVPKQFQHLYFHVSDRENRESIERTGLRATPIYGPGDEETGKKGVFITKEPSDEYGDDIYAADLAANGVEDKRVSAVGWHYNPYPADHVIMDAGISDVKRVGHFYNNGTSTEVHWHKEEECPNGQK